MSKKEALHQSISNEIRSKILSREYKLGDALPSENDFCKIYNTSRMTIRSSLATLEKEGYIFSHHGKGYFVSKPENNRYIMYLNLEDPGYSVKINNVHVEYPDEYIKMMLDLNDKDSKVYIIRRIIFKSSMPIACDEKYMPYEKGLSIVEDEIKYADFESITQKKVSPFELSSDIEIASELPSEEMCGLLRCRHDEPLTVVYRMVEGSDGVKIGYGITYMRQVYGRLKAHAGYAKQKQ